MSVRLGDTCWTMMVDMAVWSSWERKRHSLESCARLLGRTGPKDYMSTKPRVPTHRGWSSPADSPLISVVGQP